MNGTTVVTWRAGAVAGLAGVLIMTGAVSGVADTLLDEADLDRRIAELRQGDFVVRVRDASGRPVTKPVSYTLVRHEFPFGTAVDAKWLLADPETDADARRYQDTLAKYFNGAVAENAHKWYAMEPRQGERDDATALAVWEKCRDLGLPMRGHCILWGNQNFVQPWLKKLTAPELEQAIHNRTRHVLELFEGKITEWDVNNEMVHGDYYARTLGLTNGAAYFEWARRIAPGNVYYVNDFRSLQEGTEMIFQHVRSLIEAGAVVGGIGEQGHFQGEVPDTRHLWTSLDRLGQLNLPVKITEFDIQTGDEARQAADTRRFFKTCFAHPAVHGIYTWGFWEGAHWIPAAAMWRRDWSIKPNGVAYTELMDEWRTQGKARPDEEGRIRFRGFFGSYKLECGGAQAQVELHQVGAREVSITVANSHANPEMGRSIENFDRDWRFARFGLQPDGTRKPEPNDAVDVSGVAVENADSPAATGHDDSDWRPLDVPHDWGIEGPFRMDIWGGIGKLPWKGIGWYRKTFDVSATDAGRRIFVDFDGAMAYAQVWCNGAYVGGWPYGYNSFRLELTPHLKFGGKNVIAVRLDTEKWDSRWYPGAGIYRHVWLTKTAPVHVGHWGVFVTTPDVTDAAATVRAAVTVDNRGDDLAAVTVRTEIRALNAKGEVGRKVAVTDSSPVTIPAGASATVTQETVVSKPKRWDLASPNRYVARTTVIAGGKTIDTYDTPFGIRTLEFTARDGFLLNGKRVEIRGTCNHHDLGALGAAVNTRALERQFEILREMGCNAVRSAHNPPAPELLDLADRMGFLVWVDAFDTWTHGKRPNDYNKLWDDWHEKDLRTMVRRDRNHPSVFLWATGNEVEKDQFNVPLTKRLADIVRAEDPTRPVSNAYNYPGGARDSGAAMAIDVMGINYDFAEQERFDADPRYRDMPTIGSETASCVSSRGEYFFGTHRENFQVSSYDADYPPWGCTPDRQFAINERFPHLLGEFVWTGFDYIGEPLPYEIPKSPARSSYFGIVDLAGFPKDRFYMYQAHWRPELPMAHILPHWNWPDRVGLTTPVHVYTSGDEAELFLNGASLGRKAKRPKQDYRLVWDDVTYAPGELKVVAYKAGKKWATGVMKTTGPAVGIELEADRPRIAADGLDLAFVTVRIVDKDGLTVPRSSNLVSFEVVGPGEIVAVDNGDATSLEPFQASRCKAFNGLALVIVRSSRGQHGSFKINAVSDGLKPESVRIRAK